MPTERIEEVLDRLGEMEHALPGLRKRSPAAVGYLVKELGFLIAECTEERDRWQKALDHALTLAGESGEVDAAVSKPAD